MFSSDFMASRASIFMEPSDHPCAAIHPASKKINELGLLHFVTSLVLVDPCKNAVSTMEGT